MIGLFSNDVTKRPQWKPLHSPICGIRYDKVVIEASYQDLTDPQFNMWVTHCLIPRTMPGGEIQITYK